MEENNSGPKWFLVFIVVCLLAGAFLFFQNKNGTTGENGISTSTPDANLQEYMLSEYNISFMYPSNYFVSTSTSRVGTTTHTGIVLMLDTPENHNLSSTPREGPTAITLDVYPNPKMLSADMWVRANATTSNYQLRKGEGTLRKSFIAAHDAFEFEWSGLYEGVSDVIVNGPYAYVWSVTRLTPDDQILKDYLTVIPSVRFTISSTEDPSLR